MTDHINTDGANELLVFVFDPSNYGEQVFGKQRISAIDQPGGDTYTPASGIWQTVWLEQVPQAYISAVRITPDLKGITVVVNATAQAHVRLSVFDEGAMVSSRCNTYNTAFRRPLPFVAA